VGLRPNHDVLTESKKEKKNISCPSASYRAVYVYLSCLQNWMCTTWSMFYWK